MTTTQLNRPDHSECKSSKGSWLDRVCRERVRAVLEQIPLDCVDVYGADHDSPMPGDRTAIRVLDPRFYSRAALGGSLGFAESYLRGEWSTADLMDVMCLLARNLRATQQAERGVARLLRPLRASLNRLRRNTRRGSRRNIAAHYDLSNEFFALMLDSTMTYSCGIFADRQTTLQQASLAKYDRICRKLELTPQDHVLEIGGGWGGFAVFAAQQYGCRVTTTTISPAQFEYARQRVGALDLDGRVEVVQKDYRDLSGSYDKLVSIEMIEAVGERFLDSYFRCCSNLLKPQGSMLLQAITIPDHRYDTYRQSVDFIQRYVFPGGFLPCQAAMGDAVRTQTDFRLLHSEDFAAHYAETLSHWRDAFWNNIQAVRDLGFDERFIRTWDYYLCYCQAGFDEHQIGVSQILLAKPQCRRELLTAIK